MSALPTRTISTDVIAYPREPFAAPFAANVIIHPFPGGYILEDHRPEAANRISIYREYTTIEYPDTVIDVDEGTTYVEMRTYNYLDPDFDIYAPTPGIVIENDKVVYVIDE